MGNSTFSVFVYNSSNETVKVRLFDVNNNVFDVVLKAEESWSKVIPLDLCSISLVPLPETNQNTFSYTVHNNEKSSTGVIIKKKCGKLAIVSSSPSDKKKEVSSIWAAKSTKMVNFEENNGLVIFNDTSKDVKICVTLGHTVKRNTHVILAPNQHNVIPTKVYLKKNKETHTLTLLKMDDNDPNQVITKFTVDDETQGFRNSRIKIKYICLIEKEGHSMFQEAFLHKDLYNYMERHKEDPTSEYLFKQDYAKYGSADMIIVKKKENGVYELEGHDYERRSISYENDFWDTVGDDTSHLD